MSENAVVYARYSSRGQNEQSIEGQLAAAREYASKKGYTINTIAAAYGGGGHVNAAGVKGLTKRSLSTMFSTLSEMSLR